MEKRKELLRQILTALEDREGCLQDGPTLFLLRNGRKVVPARVVQTGSFLNITTGRVWKRALKIPLASIRPRDSGNFLGG